MAYFNSHCTMINSESHLLTKCGLLCSLITGDHQVGNILHRMNFCFFYTRLIEYELFVIYKNDCRRLIKWCRHQESNSGPTDYKSVALPTELCRPSREYYSLLQFMSITFFKKIFLISDCALFLIITTY